MPPPETDEPAASPRLALDPRAVPDPDPVAEPHGFVVAGDDGTRLHFLDWGEPDEVADVASSPERPLAPVLLVPGFGWSAWGWTPVARRIHRLARTLVVDLRGHGLSDAPVDGYDITTLALDALAVVDGAGVLPDEGPADDRSSERRAAPVVATPDGRPAGHPSLVLAGHGFGGAVAAAAAALLGPRCGGLVLVDGGWESIATSSALGPEEFARSLEEPPEVLRSMAAFLGDRQAFDPGSWDADQARAARETVAILPSGRLVPAIHPHVRDGIVDTMFAYDPVETLARVDAPILALVAADDETGAHRASLVATDAALRDLGRGAIASVGFDEGHNLMRYRPAEVAAAILGLVEAAGQRARGG